MRRSLTDLPEPLLDSGATDFERRMLEAVRQKRPSSETSATMAQALGLTATSVGAAVIAKSLAAEAAASKATATAGATAVWPWVTASVIGVVVAGAIVGTQLHKPPPASTRLAAPAAISPMPSTPPPSEPRQSITLPQPATAAPEALPTGPGRRGRTTGAAGELRDQIALIDAARAAVASGSGPRALDLVRRYQDKYPAGSFRPEATALKVEALMKLGREAEARGLAERFVAEHRGSLLADRVAELAGLRKP
jgi:hypothetical protein